MPTRVPNSYGTRRETTRVEKANRRQTERGTEFIVATVTVEKQSRVLTRLGGEDRKLSSSDRSHSATIGSLSSSHGESDEGFSLTDVVSYQLEKMRSSAPRSPA